MSFDTFACLWAQKAPKAGYKDRDCIFCAQVLMGPALFIMMEYWGCAPLEATGFHGSNGGEMSYPQPRVSLWAFVCTVLYAQIGFAAQMPSNVGIYTKLVGSTHAGVFQALLQLLMGVAQTVGGQFVGVAYQYLGPCALWATTFGFWMFQFIPMLWHWRAWDPAEIAACHAQIAAEADALRLMK